jgi:hypothetical protein
MGRGLPFKALDPTTSRKSTTSLINLGRPSEGAGGFAWLPPPRSIGQAPRPASPGMGAQLRDGEADQGLVGNGRRLLLGAITLIGV